MAHRASNLAPKKQKAATGGFFSFGDLPTFIGQDAYVFSGCAVEHVAQLAHDCERAQDEGDQQDFHFCSLFKL